MFIIKSLLYRAIILFTIVCVLLSDIRAQLLVKKVSAVSFKKHVIYPKFISEGCTAGDVNNDGLIDISAGNFWFEAPGFKKHLIHTDTLNPIPGYSTTFINFSMDVNSDGWIDLIRFDQPGGLCVWYENSKNPNILWKSHLILKTAGMETPAFVDVDLDGRPDIICNDVAAKQVIWLKSPVAKKDTMWRRFAISNDSTRATDRYTHGLGWGDVNKDGRNDVLIKSGWWESPKNVKSEGWKFHPADFGEDCADMFVYDVDNDGDQDVVSSSAHDYGIWWHEQVAGDTGQNWVTHEISKSFSQTHALAFKDIDADGKPDLITGKRYFAHNGKDPGEFEPAVLYWFKSVPGKNPEWIPYEIDNNSGIGTNFVVRDINKDNLPDIVISNKKGVYFFEQIKTGSK